MCQPCLCEQGKFAVILCQLPLPVGRPGRDPSQYSLNPILGHAAPSDPGRSVSQNSLPVDAAHAEVFDFEEFLEAVFRAPVNYKLGPMLLSFMPPKGAISPMDPARCALVDADDAVFERFVDAPDAADVAAVEIGRGPSLPSPARRGGLGWGVSLAILTAWSLFLKR
jgi:hypothetical protein